MAESLAQRVERLESELSALKYKAHSGVTMYFDPDPTAPNIYDMAGIRRHLVEFQVTTVLHKVLEVLKLEVVDAKPAELRVKK